MSNKFSSVLSWLHEHWKAISAIIAAILALCVGAVASSCGSSVKAVVSTPRHSSVTHISISTTNPTTVSPETSTNPNIDVK